MELILIPPPLFQLVWQEREDLGRRLQGVHQHFLRPSRPGDQDDHGVCFYNRIQSERKKTPRCVGAGESIWPTLRRGPSHDPFSAASARAKPINPAVIRSLGASACGEVGLSSDNASKRDERGGFDAVFFSAKKCKYEGKICRQIFYLFAEVWVSDPIALFFKVFIKSLKNTISDRFVFNMQGSHGH